MILKKIFIYLFAFNMIFFPMRQSNAVVPLVVGAAYALDLIAPVAIRYLASEIAISSMVKAVQYSNAYYSATSKLSNVKFLKYFKSKTALGVAAFVGVVDAVGLYLASDGLFYSDSEGSQDVTLGTPQKGYYWSTSIASKPSVSGISSVKIASLQEKFPTKSFVSHTLETANPNSLVLEFYEVKTNSSGEIQEIFTTTLRPFKAECNSGTSDIASCKDDYVTPPSSSPVEDSDALDLLLSNIEKLDEDTQKSLFANEDGVFDDALKDNLEADSAPPMPDNETPIPNIGDSSWVNANAIVNGTAQSSDSSLPNYVSESDWPDADYLGNVIANNNPYITGINSGDIPIPNSSIDGVTDEVGNITVSIDVSGIETRLDKNNAQNETVINELLKLNTSSIILQNAPIESHSFSFWTVKYPNGIQGVLSDFMNKMKQTPLFEWLNGFIINSSSGQIPSFEICFNTIASVDFGCFTLSAEPYIWNSIKASMIILALIFSRRIVFGG